MPDNESGAISPTIRTTTGHLRAGDHWDHLTARFAVRRAGHRVEPGLYAMGSPTPDAPVFVSANYTLSFDALRSALKDRDGYILVLDTDGVNVWCAAGKGTFGTDELVRRIAATHLADIVRHRTLIVPQLGAPGVSAAEVRKRSGFKVEYGPIRAVDLPEYLQRHAASDAMRRVRFDLRDRIVLIPVEVVYVLLPVVVGAVAGYLFGGWLTAGAIVTAILAGVVLFPLLLPWLPTRDFSSKGLTLGVVVMLPFALAVLLGNPDKSLWLKVIQALGLVLALAPVTSFLALNFTGSTTFTSRTGVRREIFKYIPLMAWLFGAGVVLTLAHAALRMLGGVS